MRVLICVILLCPVSVLAQVINAASCSSANVQTAFNSITSSTTTVNIPSCAGQNWTTQVTLTVPSGSTSLSILGAGSLSTIGGGDVTNIVDNAATGNTPILVINATNSSTLFRLAGITFKGGAAGTGNDKYDGMVQFQGSSSKVRVDHVHFNTATYSPALASSSLQFNGCNYGVVDHNIFDNSSGSVNNSLRAYNQGSCYSDSLGIGDQAWAHPTNFGTANFIYAENNTFNSGAADDCTDGGSFVMRFNTFNMTSPPPTTQTHPTGGAGRIRGCRAEEVYQNTMTANPSNYINADLWISSGTAMVWGNTIPSSSTGGGTGYKNFIELLDMRVDNSTYAQTATPNGWGYCGTSFNGTGSNWDKNSPSAVNGYPCLDQPGRGQGDLLTGGFSSDGSGSNNVTNNATGCISTASCAYPRQALEPIYEWLDNYSLVPSNPSNLLAVAQGTFTNNVDYYLWCNASSQSGCTSFTGATGVGSGVLASRPGTCTTGVAYWATDQGSWNSSGGGGQGVLYKCTSTNTWTASYTPYAYPHPLIAGGSGPAASGMHCQSGSPAGGLPGPGGTPPTQGQPCG